MRDRADPGETGPAPPRRRMTGRAPQYQRSGSSYSGWNGFAMPDHRGVLGNGKLMKQTRELARACALSSAPAAALLRSSRPNCLGSRRGGRGFGATQEVFSPRPDCTLAENMAISHPFLLARTGGCDGKEGDEARQGDGQRAKYWPSWLPARSCPRKTWGGYSMHWRR